MSARGLRNNNPGNIRINSDKFQGEITPSTDKSFKQFRTMAYGYRAMIRIVKNYHKNYSLKTISGIVKRWAPPVENDTEAYIRTVSQRSGLAPDKEININDKSQVCAIIAAMSYVENGTQPNSKDVEQGWDML